MAKSDQRSERNKIRAHYEKKYAGKLREKDESIRGLLREIDRLNAENKALNERLSLEHVTVMRLDELVKELQKWSELSDSDVEKLKADLGSRHEAVKTLESLGAVARAIPGRDGIIAGLYGVMGLGKY